MDKKDRGVSKKVCTMFHDFSREPYRKFNLAFALMTIVPFLVFLYLLVTELFSLEIILGNIGFVLIITFFLAILGYCKGYSLIRNMLLSSFQYVKKTKLAYEKLKDAQSILVQGEKFKVIGQLASGTAHEIRNPLGTLLQGVAYLEENTALEKDNATVLDMMKRNIKRADDVVHTLINFSRVGTLDMKEEKVNPIIENSLCLIQHRVEMRNIKFIKELGDDIPDILCDSIKLEQVFVNLFLNAVQAMPKGGTVFMRSYSKRLDKPGHKVGNRIEDYFKVGETAVIFEVEDTGVGISDGNINKIFEPFFTLRNDKKGTGLGLSVASSIVDMHSGLIEVTSNEGQGTKFTIFLKTSKCDGRVHKEPKKIVEKKKVMIVDDEEDFLEITKLNLESTDKYEILILGDASNIISQVHRFQPDIILLDIMMSGVDGLTACDKLNKDYLGKNIPIIMLSALCSDKDKLKAYKMGVVDYIEKPVVRSVLVNKIEKALQCNNDL